MQGEKQTRVGSTSTGYLHEFMNILPPSHLNYIFFSPQAAPGCNNLPNEQRLVPACGQKQKESRHKSLGEQRVGVVATSLKLDQDEQHQKDRPPPWAQIRVTTWVVDEPLPPPGIHL